MSAEEPTNVAAEAVQPEETPAAEDTEVQLETLQKQAQEYLEGWQRARAEFANYKRRMERELQENRDMAMGIAFKGMLPIVDDFDRALASIPSELQGNPWVNGVSMVQRKLIKLMEENGVTQFDPVGEMFDPTRHEAVATDDEGDAPSGQVTTTMQRGYLIGDKVLRPALVKVKR